MKNRVFVNALCRPDPTPRVAIHHTCSEFDHQRILSRISAVGPATALVPKRQRHAVCCGISSLSKKKPSRRQSVCVTCGVGGVECVRIPRPIHSVKCSAAHGRWSIRKRGGSSDGTGFPTLDIDRSFLVVKAWPSEVIYKRQAHGEQQVPSSGRQGTLGLLGLHGDMLQVQLKFLTV
jgi:hypothetical protein